MGSAWETNATDEVRRISSFLSVCARADKGHRSMVHKLPATILAFAGFVSTSELKVTCSYCHYEPDLEKIQNIVKKAPISILFVLILEHLRNAQTCIISKLCFVAYFSKEQIRETLNNIIISSKQNLKQDSYLELDCEQGFQKDSAKQMNFLEVKLSISADSLSFESLAKRCKDTTNMKSAEARLLTFKNWCFTHVVTPLALACDGFYRHESKSASDSVKCVYCGLTLFQWEPNDVVSMEHRDKSPNCPFKTGKVANDILNETEVYYHRCLTMFRSKLFDEKVLKSDQDFNATVKKILNLFSFKDNLMLTNEAIFSKLSIDIQINENDIQSPGECGAGGGKLEFDSLTYEPRDDTRLEVNQVWKRRRDQSSNMSEEEIQSAILKISEENSRLKESKLCKICIDKDIDTVFLPCGHLVSCQGCAPRIKTCAVCRTLIRGTVLAFIPND